MQVPAQKRFLRSEPALSNLHNSHGTYRPYEHLSSNRFFFGFVQHSVRSISSDSLDFVRLMMRLSSNFAYLRLVYPVPFVGLSDSSDFARVGVTLRTPNVGIQMSMLLIGVRK